MPDVIREILELCARANAKAQRAIDLRARPPQPPRKR